MANEHIPGETALQPRIVEVRRASVILDADIARMFGVEVRRLNEQVRRNATKFDGFAFRLTEEELRVLMSQIATSSSGHGGRRKLPYVFTEHGVVMAATVLQSEQAIAASRFIIKVFVEARRKSLAPYIRSGASMPSRFRASSSCRSVVSARARREARTAGSSALRIGQAA